MKWKIDVSSGADKFLAKNKISEKDVIQLVVKAIRFMEGDAGINIDIKKLRGQRKGFYRVRKGKIRIILTFNFEKCRVIIDNIDFRGNIYK